MKFRTSLGVGGVIAILSAASAANAAYYTLHDGESGPLDFIALTWVSGDKISAPTAFRDDPSGNSMSDFGWTQVATPDVAYATFASTGAIDFDIAVDGVGNPGTTSLLLYGYNGDTQVFRETVVSNFGDGGNSAWDSNYLNPDSTTRASLSAAPEPASLALLTLGAVGLLIRRRRNS